MDHQKYLQSPYHGEIKKAMQALNSLRTNQENPRDISFSEFIKSKWDVSTTQFYEQLGIDPARDTIQNFFNLPDEDARFLLPEVIRDSIRLGLRKAPIWANVIAMEENISQPQITMPWWNMSEATPRTTGVAETIPTGDMAFASKVVRLEKLTRGIRIPYEVMQYVAVNVVSIFLEDFGVRMGQRLDAMCINTLINGEQISGAESAAVVGVSSTITGITYADILRVWIRMTHLGRTPNQMIGGEDIANRILLLTEFKDRQSSGPLLAEAQLQIPVPQNSQFYIHEVVPSDQVIVNSSESAIIKFNSQPLLIESERVVSNQTEGTYASMTTGFAVIYRDGRIIIDQSLAFTGAGAANFQSAGNEFLDVSQVDNVPLN